MSWEPYQRETRRSYASSHISPRKTGFAFSAKFLKENQIVSDRVTIYVDEQMSRVGFHFHYDKEDPNAYSVADDGKSGGKFIGASRFWKDNPKMAKVLALGPKERRFVPKRFRWEGHTPFIWAIDLTVSPGSLPRSPAGRPRASGGSRGSRSRTPRRSS